MLGAADPFVIGQQRLELFPGPACIAGMPGPAGQVGASGQGLRVRRAEHPLDDGQQGRELALGSAGVPGLSGPAGQGDTDRESPLVLTAELALEIGQQHVVLVPGPGRIPRLPGPAGQAGTGGQGVRVLGTRDPLERVKVLFLQLERGYITALLAKVVREPDNAGALLRKGGPGVRQQRRADGPDFRRVGIVRDRGLDEAGCGLAPLSGASPRAI